jgi:hypothetical protein
LYRVFWGVFTGSQFRDPNPFDIPDAISFQKRNPEMNKHTVFVTGLVLLAIFVIGAAIWVIVYPPLQDEMQAYALVAIGIFMLIIGYELSKRKPERSSTL